MRQAATLDGVEVRGRLDGRFSEVLTPEALAFVAGLHRTFAPERRRLLRRRAERQAALDAGTLPDFLPATHRIREAEWQVAPAPRDLRDRRVEITGPVDRKMIIQALGSGASVFMADFEDALSPTWENVIGGQVNLMDAVRGTIEFTAPDGRVYRLPERTATLMVRPRGWHMEDRHVRIDGEPVSAALLDFGLYFFHNAAALVERGSGPYFYLPKLEGHEEARLWNEVFLYAQDALGMPRGTVRASVLIEHVLAAFEMDEILYELRDHAAGLNAGRWDYIFSIIKCFRHRPEFVLPDRAQVTMTVPFMRAYTDLLVKTCHRRGTHALGGMAAFVPSRKDPRVNEVAFARVREDKEREAADGFDGTWVAHPDLVPVAMEVFERRLGGRPHQLERRRDEVAVGARDLLDVRVPGGEITEAGLRNNVNVALQYLEAWLRGVGCSAIHHLMEDAATAEIARAQIWQWVRHGARLREGPAVTRERVRRVMAEELEALRSWLGEAEFARRRFGDARELLEHVALGEGFCEFLTIPAYDYLA